MKGRTAQYLPRSACDDYEPGERVTAWEPSDSAAQDIFKQLRLNLNHYERRYNQSKERDHRRSSSGVSSPSSPVAEKENYIKLPAIPTLPLKHAHSNKEPFVIKNRNILEDAMNRFDQNKPRQQRGVRITKIRKVRRQEQVNIMGPQFRLDFQRNISPQEQPSLTERSLKQVHSRRGTSQLVDYDFSDVRFLPQSMLSRGLGKENR